MSEGAFPAGGGRLAARFVAIAADQHLAPGEIVWDGKGRIVALRKARGPVLDLCILPGLVNAHAHLQIAPLVRRERRFLPWIRAVLAARVRESATQQKAIGRAALRQLLATGTTAVGEIDATGSGITLVTESLLAGRCYRELTGFHLNREQAAQLIAQRHAPRPAAAPVAVGLSPHAPYSVSAELFRAAAAASRHLSVHCAEVPEEQDFLRTGRGPFADLLVSMGRLPDALLPPGVGAVRWLERLAVLRPGTQLVHCQELERGDAARIALAGASIVVCPGTIEWFGRSPPPVPTWLAEGIPVALGTDSLASNATFSLRDELRRAARMWPTLSATQLFAMATRHGGDSLGLHGLGVLRRGGRADFVAVPAGGAFLSTLHDFVHGESPLAAVVCRGRRTTTADLRR